MVATTHTHLMDGEVFTSNNRSDEQQIILPDTEIDKKYRRGEMRIITEQGRINLHSIVTTLDSTQGEKSKYILNPVYQRRKRWDIPPIFLYEVEYARYEVMDGLQRLTAIYDFYKGNFRLEGLEYWEELNGRTYDELPENVRAGIDRRYLSSIILLEETAKSLEDAEFLKRIVFDRLNSGGEKLKPQETRNALYSGKFNKLCLKLAKKENFRKMWHLPLMNTGEKELLKSDPHREMADVELVLRFFAYRHVNNLTSPMDKFLDNFLNQANNYPDHTINRLEDLFNKTIDTIHEIYGKDAFLLPKKEKKQYRSPSKTVYDAMMQAFANNVQYQDNFIVQKEAIRENLYDDREPFRDEDGTYLFAGNLNSKKIVIRRIKYFHNYLQNYIS